MNNGTRTRFGVDTFLALHPDLDLVPLFTGVRERSISDSSDVWFDETLFSESSGYITTRSNNNKTLLQKYIQKCFHLQVDN